MQLQDQATTGITTSEETEIQLKDNTSTLSALLLRAVSQLGVLEKDWSVISAIALIDEFISPNSESYSEWP
jgi:hypothetical protein